MISVIVPVYKVEQYLRQCIESILNQTYQDLEILLIDDGSPDRCGIICEEYAKKDPRIKVFHTENHGLSAARNVGLQIAKGEYIGFVDSDDWIEPDMYEILLRRLEETDTDISVCEIWREGVKEIPEKVSKTLSTLAWTRSSHWLSAGCMNTPGINYTKKNAGQIFCSQPVTIMKMSPLFTK